LHYYFHKYFVAVRTVLSAACYSASNTQFVSDEVELNSSRKSICCASFACQLTREQRPSGTSSFIFSFLAESLLILSVIDVTAQFRFVGESVATLKTSYSSTVRAAGLGE
jgi:hypothetical protein